MSEIAEALSKFLSEENKLESIKLEYSFISKILIIFTENNIYIIDNSTNIPSLKSKIKSTLNIRYTTIHPQNQNQLLIITKDEFIYLVSDIKSFTSIQQIRIVNLNTKNIISAKFSFFDNFFGILFDDYKFNLYYLNENSEIQNVLSEELDTKYIDFTFIPHFSLGFEIFMILFMTKNGELYMYGPFFPMQFSLKKEYSFNMNNYLLYKLNSMKNNNLEYQKYVISLAIINDLEKSKIKEDKDNYIIQISDKIKRINATFKKREIGINNNFLNNNYKEDFINIKYKQIFVLKKRPLTVLRIFENNNMDIIILSEEIFPELAQVGNIISEEEIKKDNFLVEFIQINDNNNIIKELVNIIQYDNNQIFIRTNDSLFLIQIPYLNDFKTIAEDNIMVFPNKMKKTFIQKIIKWNNDNNMYYMRKNKVININDILIIPELKKAYIFGILKEKLKNKENQIKEIRKVVIKESKYKDMNEINNSIKFSDIINSKNNKKDYISNVELKLKLQENDFIKNEIKNIKLNIDENLIEKDANFENKLNDNLKTLYQIYRNLLEKNDEIILTKINIMKYIYTQLSKSNIKNNIDDTISRINKLKITKEKILKNNEIIESKIKIINDKIKQYELKDEETDNYLNILKKYQKDLGDKLYEIEKKIKFCYDSINKVYFFKDLFPQNDLEFNLIEKENQKKYLKFEEEINNSSKELFLKIQK